VGAAPAPQPAYSLSSVLADKAAVDGAPAVGAAAASPTVEQALAVAAGADAASARNRLPDAPAGVSAAELVDRGHAAFDAGRLNEARTNYQMALKLDPACTICTVRIQRLDADIARQAQQQYDAGVRYFDQLQYAEAESAFQTVLLLVPDPTDLMHVRATESLQRVRA
jgi:tetratricopeptide (TPR) repeat protein